jgi:hypothetical protein
MAAISKGSVYSFIDELFSQYKGNRPHRINLSAIIYRVIMFHRISLFDYHTNRKYSDQVRRIISKGISEGRYNFVPGRLGGLEKNSVQQKYFCCICGKSNINRYCWHCGTERIF